VKVRIADLGRLSSLRQPSADILTGFTWLGRRGSSVPKVALASTGEVVSARKSFLRKLLRASTAFRKYQFWLIKRKGGN
jgi:hypothetical protein